MNKIIRLLFIITMLTISSMSLYAQTNCNCEEALKQLINKVETEYPGYKEKTKNKLLYSRRTYKHIPG